MNVPTSTKADPASNRGRRGRHHSSGRYDARGGHHSTRGRDKTTDVEAISCDCALKNFGNAANATKCIQDETGLSDACVACFGEINACGMSKCLALCFNPSSPECTACIDANCMPAFEEYPGLEAD